MTSLNVESDLVNYLISAASSNAPQTVILSATLAIGWFAYSQYNKVKTIDEKLKKYECEFLRFEKKINCFIDTGKLPKEANAIIKDFLIESQLVLGDKK